jgi:hypothetical protein
MDDIKIKAQKLIDANLILYKPIAWQKHQEKQINDYWDKFGKEIVAVKLIKTFSDVNEYRKLECAINPLDNYLLEPSILYLQKLISELEFYKNK